MDLEALRSSVACEISRSRVLAAIGESILDTKRECEKWASSCEDDDEQLESIGEDYRIDTEQLIGVCFVACQQMINTVCGRAFRIDQELEEFKERNYEESRRKNLRYGSNTCNDITEIQIIDAAANLFKHYDEWPVHMYNPDNPKRMSTSSRCIIELLKKARIIVPEPLDKEDKPKWNPYPPFTKDILLQVSEKLGNPTYSDTHIFHSIVTRWADEILRKYEEIVANQFSKPAP